MRKALFFFLSLTVLAFAQKRETRAVWVATNFRLDWPPPVYDEIEQKIALDEIFRAIRKKNFNTVYFQAVVKGTALYNSRLLPFCPYISGFEENVASYDPLQYAVALAHRYGLEIHAWINTARVFSGEEYEFLNMQEHITRLHPDWIVIDGYGREASYWLDFGIPEARKFMAEVAREIAENYDVDGIQFDFLRYPGNDFDDGETYKAFADTLSLDDWRRENITRFVKEAYDSIKAVNFEIKVGVAPFGIYKNIPGAKGGESFSFVYQDSKKWLAEKIVDYLVPQTYWNIDDNPRFDSLAFDWARSANGRNVVLGVAAYKPEVLEQKNKVINIARKAGAAGLAFFRYKFIENVDFPEFEEFVYSKEMPWIDSTAPAPPKNFVVKVSDNAFELRWEKASDKEINYYSLYDVTFAPTLVAIFDGETNRARMEVRRPRSVINKFQLRSVDKLRNESEPTETVSIELAEISALAVPENVLPQKPFVNKFGDDYYLVVSSNSFTPEKLKIIRGEVSRTVELQHGVNIISVKISRYDTLTLEFPARNEKVKLEVK